jgi:hypothetical protein
MHFPSFLPAVSANPSAPSPPRHLMRTERLNPNIVAHLQPRRQCHPIGFVSHLSPVGALPKPGQIGFVLRISSPDAAELGSFRTSDPTQLGSFRIFRPLGPCPSRAQLGSFCTFDPCPTPLGPRPARRRRGIGFVSHVCPAGGSVRAEGLGDGLGRPSARNWLCFAGPTKRTHAA